MAARHGRVVHRAIAMIGSKDRILDRTTPEQRAKYVEYRRACV